MLRRELNVDVNDKILIRLADHISFALSASAKGVPCENPLLLEIQQFYRKGVCACRAVRCRLSRSIWASR